MITLVHKPRHLLLQLSSWLNPQAQQEIFTQIITFTTSDYEILFLSEYIMEDPWIPTKSVPPSTVITAYVSRISESSGEHNGLTAPLWAAANRWQQRLVHGCRQLHVVPLVLSVPQHHTAHVLQTSCCWLSDCTQPRFCSASGSGDGFPWVAYYSKISPGLIDCHTADLAIF